MPQKKKLYCGEEETLPKGYSAFGSRFDCLKKGYGAALIYSTEDQRKAAIKRMMERAPKKLDKEKLILVAQRVGIPSSRPNGSKKTRNDLIDDIISKLDGMYN
jgi:hypothetical protein